MSKKLYVWAANYIVWDYQDCAAQGNFKYLASYRAFVALFSEFGKEFSIEKFDSYIEKKLTNS